MNKSNEQMKEFEEEKKPALHVKAEGKGGNSISSRVQNYEEIPEFASDENKKGFTIALNTLHNLTSPVFPQVKNLFTYFSDEKTKDECIRLSQEREGRLVKLSPKEKYFILYLGQIVSKNNERADIREWIEYSENKIKGINKPTPQPIRMEIDLKEASLALYGREKKEQRDKVLQLIDNIRNTEQVLSREATINNGTQKVRQYIKGPLILKDTEEFADIEQTTDNNGKALTIAESEHNISIVLSSVFFWNYRQSYRFIPSKIFELQQEKGNILATEIGTTFALATIEQSFYNWKEADKVRKIGGNESQILNALTYEIDCETFNERLYSYDLKDKRRRKEFFDNIKKTIEELKKLEYIKKGGIVTGRKKQAKIYLIFSENLVIKQPSKTEKNLQKSN